MKTQTQNLLKPTLKNNLWVARYNILFYLMFIIMNIYVRPTDNEKIFIAILLFISFAGIVFLGFFAIAAHLQYYFKFEKLE